MIAILIRFVGVVVTVFLISGCADKNEHFCAKYSYFYKELTAPGILPIHELRAQLQQEKRKQGADSDRANMALFVLADIERDMKPDGEAAQAYCMRRKRWEGYR